MSEVDLKTALYQAFPKHREGPKHLDHASFVELRRDLSLLDHDSLQRCLPQVLVDLLETHTNDPGNEEGAESVIRCLEVVSDSRNYDSDVEFLGRAAADGISAENSERDLLKESVFAGFTNEQAAALARWLEIASQWTDFKYCRAELDSALAYWKWRSETRGGPP